jgi:hypothetical protein
VNRAGQPPDRQRGADERQRRDDHVDALTCRQPRVDHRAGLVDAPIDLRDDPIDRLQQLLLAPEVDVRALNAAVALDEHVVGAVDHDLGDRLVGEQWLEHAETDRLVDDLADQPAPLRR